MEAGRDVPEELGLRIIGRLNELIRQQQIAALGPERVLTFAHLDRWVRLHLPLAEVDVIQRRILAQRSFFEAEMLADIRPLIPPGAVVVDAGANIGNHSVSFALIAEAHTVHAFEPMRVAFSTLLRNIEINGLADRVRPHHTAVGAREGSAALLRYVEHNTGGTVLGLAQPGAYPVTTIDALALPRCDFIKIDVEGAHLEAIEGARETLARCRPAFWVELRAKRGEFEQGAAALAARGYRVLRPVAGSDSDFLFVPA